MGHQEKMGGRGTKVTVESLGEMVGKVLKESEEPLDLQAL